jgi:hypothetical protein
MDVKRKLHVQLRRRRKMNGLIAFCSVDGDFGHVYDLWPLPSEMVAYVPELTDETGAWVRKGGYNMCFLGWVCDETEPKWVVRFRSLEQSQQNLLTKKLKTEVATI